MFEKNQKRLHTWDMFEKNQKRLHTWASLVKGKSENEKLNERNIFLSCRAKVTLQKNEATYLG